MKPHEERVIEEKRDLDEKMAKLRAFIDGEEFGKLDEAQRTHLEWQIAAMASYSGILGLRVAAFPVEYKEEA